MKKGIINSFQSLGTLDGPGVRFVVFMQGCPYRCIYCHNPETWDFKNSNAIVMTPQELIDKIIPYKPYFGKVGGVTVSGGEPLCQAEFLIDFFTLCHENGITTALDTTGGVLNPLNEKLISLCDYILLDIKFSTTEDYKKYTSHQKNQNTSCEKADFFISKSSTLSKNSTPENLNFQEENFESSNSKNPNSVSSSSKNINFENQTLKNSSENQKFESSTSQNFDCLNSKKENFKNLNSESSNLNSSGISLENVISFLELADKFNNQIILRHVVLKTINDTSYDTNFINTLKDSYKNITKIEYLPLSKLCTEKYKKLGIPFLAENLL